MINKTSIDFINQSQIIQTNMHTVKGELDGSPTTDNKYHARPKNSIDH